MSNAVDVCPVNLTHSEQAVAYVKKKMTIGAANKPSDLFSSLFKSEWSRTCVARIRKTPGYSTATISNIRTVSQVAVANGCGNCGEQAAVAFIWLMDKKIAPLDYMSRVNADHAFVVVGREGDIANPANWGENCFICDPWDGKAYSIHDVSEKMYGGGKIQPKSIARWEG